MRFTVRMIAGVRVTVEVWVTIWVRAPILFRVRIKVGVSFKPFKVLRINHHSKFKWFICISQNSFISKCATKHSNYAMHYTWYNRTGRYIRILSIKLYLQNLPAYIKS